MILSSWHTRLLKRLFFLLLPYSILRIGFYLYHLDVYRNFEQNEILKSFLYGIRFDIAAICILNSSIILLSLLPLKSERFIKFERLLFVVVNMIGFTMTLNDYELFLFMGKRLSFDIFAVSGDIIDQLPQIAVYYWYFPLAVIALGFGLFSFDKKFFSLKNTNTTILKQTLGGVLLLALTFIGIRGGLQNKSINVQSAFIQGKNELGHLVLNSPYHFFRTFKNQKISKVTYFKNDDEAKNIILNSRDLRPGLKNQTKQNVVLLILESFSLEYMEKGYTPFLSRLAEESVFFQKHLANGRRSIEVLPSVLCGLPSIIDDPISKSSFSGNKFTCLPEVLKKEGYTNYFFHGGGRGTMGFEAYTLSVGFHKYFSRENYPGGDYDGTWGIYDEPYLQFSAEMISKMPMPFLAGIFTLSSHQPYSVPEEYKNKFPKGTLEIHESIGYTDFSLEKFFETARKMPWYENTIFIITADHTQKLETTKYKNLVGHFRVPLLIYAPGKKLPKKEKVSQHSDIPKTVLDLVGVNADGLPMTGASLFSDDAGLALNYAHGSTYFMVEGEKVLSLDKGNNSKTFELDWETGELKRAPTEDDTKLRANIQYFINGLINNNLSL